MRENERGSEIYFLLVSSCYCLSRLSSENISSPYDDRLDKEGPRCDSLVVCCVL